MDNQTMTRRVASSLLLLAHVLISFWLTHLISTATNGEVTLIHFLLFLLINPLSPAFYLLGIPLDLLARTLNPNWEIPLAAANLASSIFCHFLYEWILLRKTGFQDGIGVRLGIFVVPPHR